jgi:VWFA-related protein
MVALFATLTVPSVAQTTPATASNNPTTLHATTRLVLVPTLVRTPSKEFVYSLNAEDFFLTDRGAPQKVVLDSQFTQPLSLVVLIQTGGSAVRELTNYRNLETTLASLLGTPPNQVSIVNFDSKPEAASPFTSDITQWTYAINHPDPGDSGAAIMDSVKFALTLLDAQPTSNRRAILLICQPQDVGSKTTAREIIRIAGETNTTIYTLTFSPQMTTLKGSLRDGGHANPPLQVGNGTYQAYFNLTEPLEMIVNAMRKNVAAELANLSGGEAVQFDGQHQLDAGLNVIDADIRNRYMLTFRPTSAVPGFHPIQVRLLNYPQLIISARPGYWSHDGDGH